MSSHRNSSPSYTTWPRLQQSLLVHATHSPTCARTLLRALMRAGKGLRCCESQRCGTGPRLTMGCGSTLPGHSSAFRLPGEIAKSQAKPNILSHAHGQSAVQIDQTKKAAIMACCLTYNWLSGRSCHLKPCTSAGESGGRATLYSTSSPTFYAPFAGPAHPLEVEWQALSGILRG
jgi:hypothetical protein